MLRSAQADTFSPEITGYLGVLGLIRVCPDPEPLLLHTLPGGGKPDLVGPSEEDLQFAGYLRIYQENLALENFAGGSVQGYPVALFELFVPDGDGFTGNHNPPTAGYTG